MFRKKAELLDKFPEVTLLTVRRDGRWLAQKPLKKIFQEWWLKLDQLQTFA